MGFDTTPGAGLGFVKFGGTIPVSQEMLHPNTTPLTELTRRRKLWWAWQERVYRARMRLASWVAGFDVEDEHG